MPHTMLAVKTHDVSAGYRHALVPEDFLHARNEIGPANPLGRRRGKEPCNDAFAFGDVDFLAIAEKVFDNGKSITKIADGSLLHVMHFSITRPKSARKSSPLSFRARKARQRWRVRFPRPNTILSRQILAFEDAKAQRTFPTKPTRKTQRAR